jgi:solute carrier family 25 (adenine nucleotide translocator) protein 4/5/6/31
MYAGTLDCGSKILSKEGITGFFKGNLSNFWRSIGSSIVLVLYDELQKWVQHHGY